MKRISVDLDGIHELFQEPDFDPFDPGCRCESGIRDLYNQTQTISRKEKVQIELNLPKDAERTKTQAEIEAALKRYCDVKITHSEREIQEIRHQGVRDMGWASLISILLLLGAFIITQVTFLPEVIIYLLATGAGIIAWVALWPPLDSILYEWSPYRQTKLRYEQLRSAEVILSYRESGRENSNSEGKFLGDNLQAINPKGNDKGLNRQ
jgi:hypothetical protein